MVPSLTATYRNCLRVFACSRLRCWLVAALQQRRPPCQARAGPCRRCVLGCRRRGGLRGHGFQRCDGGEAPAGRHVIRDGSSEFRLVGERHIVGLLASIVLHNMRLAYSSQTGLSRGFCADWAFAGWLVRPVISWRGCGALLQNSCSNAIGQHLVAWLWHIQSAMSETHPDTGQRTACELGSQRHCVSAPSVVGRHRDARRLGSASARRCRRTADSANTAGSSSN